MFGSVLQAHAGEQCICVCSGHNLAGCIALFYFLNGEVDTQVLQSCQVQELVALLCGTLELKQYHVHAFPLVHWIVVMSGIIL